MGLSSIVSSLISVNIGSNSGFRNPEPIPDLKMRALERGAFGSISLVCWRWLWGRRRSPRPVPRRYRLRAAPDFLCYREGDYVFASNVVIKGQCVYGFARRRVHREKAVRSGAGIVWVRLWGWGEHHDDLFACGSDLIRSLDPSPLPVRRRVILPRVKWYVAEGIVRVDCVNLRDCCKLNKCVYCL